MPTAPWNRPVDLIGQDEIGEDRPFASAENALARVINERPDQVGRQQIGRELNAVELAMNRRRECLDGGGLGQAGHPFEQHVPPGE